MASDKIESTAVKSLCADIEKAARMVIEIGAPGRSARDAGPSQTEGITAHHIRLLVAHIGGISDALDRVSSPFIDRSSEAQKLDLDELQVLSEKLFEVHQKIKDRAKMFRDRIRKDWAEDPRIYQGTVLRPFAITNKEVPLTQGISWLITPSSSDKMKGEFLAKLISFIIKKNISPDRVANWRVTPEQHVEASDGRTGRIDIFIEGNLEEGDIRIAIEAKINANEGNGQLDRYRGKADWIVFLTKDGRRPKKGKESDVCISYAVLLDLFYPILKTSVDSVNYPFARLLLADISRDLAHTHLGNIGEAELPRGLDSPMHQWGGR